MRAAHAAVVDLLAVQAATEVAPGIAGFQRLLRTLGDGGVVRHQERGGPERALALPQQTEIETLGPFQQHGRVPLHALVHCQRLEDDDVHLGQEQVRPDAGMRRPQVHQFRGAFLAVCLLQRGDILGHLLGGGAQPFQRLGVAAGKIDFGVTVAPVADHALDLLLVRHEAVVLRADGAHERLVREADVVTVGVVLGQHLPVGGVLVTHPAGGQAQVAGGRQVTGTVDQFLGAPQVLVQGDAVGGGAGEDETAVAAAARHFQPELGPVLLEAAGMRHVLQLAIQAESPAVVRTGEALGAAGRLVAQQIAAMLATVEKHIDRAVLTAHHQIVLAPDGTGDVIARPRQLAFVGHEHPATVEDLVELVLEHVRLGIQRAVHPVGLDQIPVAGGGKTFDTHALAPA